MTCEPAARIPKAGFDLDVDNVTFVLNALDALAGDDSFIEIRKRRPQHRVLAEIEDRTEDAREESIQERKKYHGRIRPGHRKSKKPSCKKEFEKLEQQHGDERDGEVAKGRDGHADGHGAASRR